MRFEDFARAHGLVINSVALNRWVAVPTEDHPRKRNGRYKYLGEVGWVQNWATMNEPVMWRSEGATPVSIAKLQAKALDDQREAQEKAAKKAAWILGQAKKQTHPYLAAKGFPNMKGWVWNDSLILPMRIGDRLVGVQFINQEGEKKFLYGQRTKGASLVMDAKGSHIFCEGFATGLSVRAALREVGLRYCIHVCFSAGNMKVVTGNFPGGFVIADSDRNGIGEKVAMETGKPYWLARTVGYDFNDYHREVGSLEAGRVLAEAISNSAMSRAA